MLKTSNKLFKAALISLLIIIFLLSPVSGVLRSCFIMLPYSYIHHRDSVIHKNQITFHIPGGWHTKKPDWYPFVITFNDDAGLSRYLGESVEFSVLYNFGYFQPIKGTSSYYNPQSPYFSSFYGGYMVKPALENRRFGFLEDGSINADELVKVPEYDQKYLVLPSLGCPPEKRVFQENVISIHNNVEYAGYNEWIQIDSEINTNSPVHEYQAFHQGYLQYGRPMGRFDFEEDFPVVELKGRVYVKYFEELKATIVLYALAPSWKVIEEVDKEILSQTELSY